MTAKECALKDMRACGINTSVLKHDSIFRRISPKKVNRDYKGSCKKSSRG